jgi:hypothetical protein
LTRKNYGTESGCVFIKSSGLQFGSLKSEIVLGIWISFDPFWETLIRSFPLHGQFGSSFMIHLLTTSISNFFAHWHLDLVFNPFAKDFDQHLLYSLAFASSFFWTLKTFD